MPSSIRTRPQSRLSGNPQNYFKSNEQCKRKTTPPTPSATSVAEYLAGCSQSGGQNITIARGGDNYTVRCYSDCPFNDITTFDTPTLNDCIDYCSGNSTCVAVAFALNPDGQEPTCWLKTKVGDYVDNSNRVCVLKDNEEDGGN